jgi:hypothetical protein
MTEPDEEVDPIEFLVRNATQSALDHQVLIEREAREARQIALQAEHTTKRARYQRLVIWIGIVIVAAVVIGYLKHGQDRLNADQRKTDKQQESINEAFAQIRQTNTKLKTEQRQFEQSANATCLQTNALIQGFNSYIDSLAISVQTRTDIDESTKKALSDIYRGAHVDLLKCPPVGVG